MTLDRASRDRLARKAERIRRGYQWRDDEIRRCAEGGASYSEIAEAVGLSKSAVAKIVNRKAAR